MRKIYLFYFLIMFSFFANGQNLEDTTKVLQLCVDFPEIQSYYLENQSPVYIMQYPIVLPTDITVSKFDMPTVFMSRHEIYDNNVDAYFLFKQIDIQTSSAFVDYSFYYDYNSSDQKVAHLKINFFKDDESWKIDDFEMNLY